MNLFALASPRKLNQFALGVAGPFLAHKMKDRTH